MARREIEKIALYARVSTHDQQTLPMQLSALRAYAKRKGWQVTQKIEEIGSGATSRPRREELLRAARLKEITVDPKSVVIARKVDAASVGAPKTVADLQAGSTRYQAKIEMG